MREDKCIINNYIKFKKMKTKIWSLTTRISHWLLALGFTIAYFTGENEWQMNYHYAFGALAGGILFFRIIYGFIGSKYSRFRDFPMSISQQIEFLKNYFSKNTYVGHNPLASVVMISMMFVGVFTAFTGYLWATETSQFLGFTLTEEMVEESHEIGAKLFLILVFAHLAGILADTIFHRKTGTLASIFTGYKNVETEPENSSMFQKIFSIFWLGIPMFLAYLAFGLPVREGENEREQKDDDEWESLLYPDKNSERRPINITLKMAKNSTVDAASSASSNRNIEPTIAVSGDNYSQPNYQDNQYYATQNQFEDDEQEKNEHKREHHHNNGYHKKRHHDEDNDD